MEALAVTPAVQTPASSVASSSRSLRILAETAYPTSLAGPRVRLTGFAPSLRELDVALDCRPSVSDDEYRLIMSNVPTWRKLPALARSAIRLVTYRPEDYDLRLVYRLRGFLPVPGADPPRSLDVYDFDDALYLGSVSSVNKRYAAVKRTASRCIAYMRAARLVIVGNPFLAEEAMKYAARVEVVPSCVDPERQPLRLHREVEVATVGWIGSPSTSPYLAPLLPVFDRLNRTSLRARLVLVGADSTLQAPWIEHRPWSLASEAAALASFDVGVMPLPDDGWARGKSGYKLLQYFSAGVPAVASPVGVNRMLVADGRGLRATSLEQWVIALETLIGDAELRRSWGAAARTYVEQEYSYQRWAPEVARLLHSLGT